MLSCRERSCENGEFTRDGIESMMIASEIQIFWLPGCNVESSSRKIYLSTLLSPHGLRRSALSKFDNVTRSPIRVESMSIQSLAKEAKTRWPDSHFLSP